MDLIAVVSSGKGSWGQISGLMRKGEWEKIILVGPSYAKDFNFEGKVFDFVEYDDNKSVTSLKQELVTKLRPFLDSNSFGSEVALSIASGSGKEHMALISALLSIPVGVRFVALTAEGIVLM